MFSKHYVNIKGQKLNEYHRYVGGGMTGGYDKVTIKRCKDKAVIETESAEFHNDEPQKKEIIVDASVLDEIEALIRKYRMNSWNNKKFTNMFVSDGESKGYTFDFDKSSVRFSSQIYPPKYCDKLRELDSLVKDYAEKADKQV